MRYARSTAPDGLVWEFPERDELDLAILDPEDPGEDAANGPAAEAADPGPSRREAAA